MYNVVVMTTWRIELSGMHCDSCVSSVRTALESVEGVDAAEVVLKRQQATVSTTSAVKPDFLREAIQRAGFVVEQIAEHEKGPPLPAKSFPPPAETAEALPTVAGEAGSVCLEFEIEGMHCAGCVRQVREALLSVKGVSQAGVNLATRQATVVIQQSAQFRPVFNGTAEHGALRAVMIPASTDKLNRHLEFFGDPDRLILSK